jgi:hypothetical protein
MITSRRVDFPTTSRRVVRSHCTSKVWENEKETKLVVSNLKIWNLVEGIKLAAPCKLCVEHLWAGFNSTYKTNQTKLMYLGFIKKKKMMHLESN